MKKVLLAIIVLLSVFFITFDFERKIEKSFTLELNGNEYDVESDEFVGSKKVFVDGMKQVTIFKDDINYVRGFIDVEGVQRDGVKYDWADSGLFLNSTIPFYMIYSSRDTNDQNIYYFLSMFTDFDFEEFIIILYDENTTELISKETQFDDLENCRIITSYNNVDDLRNAFENRYDLLP